MILIKTFYVISYQSKELSFLLTISLSYETFNTVENNTNIIMLCIGVNHINYNINNSNCSYKLQRSLYKSLPHFNYLIVDSVKNLFV